MITGTKPLPKIGFVGTGIMGAGMAGCLIRNGYQVNLYNRTRSKAEKVAEAGGRVFSSPAEAASDADVVITMLSDPDALFETMQGDDGILTSIRPGTVLIDCSTVSPTATRQVHQMLQAKAAEMLDAPVFGSRNEAEKGKLGFLVGGCEQVLSRVEPVLSCMGQVNHIGGNGLGTSAKLVLNLIMAGTLQVFNEGMILASKSGLNPDAMLELILSSRARSGIIEMKAPQVLNRNFSPFFPLHLMAKDIRLVDEFASDFGMKLPVAGVLKQVYEHCLDAGWGAEDFCASIQALEAQADLQVRGASAQDSFSRS